MSESILTLGVASAAPEGFAQLLEERRGIEFVEGTVQFEIEKSKGVELLLKHGGDIDLISPEEVKCSYVHAGRTRKYKTFTAVSDVVIPEKEPSDKDKADEKLKKKKTVKEFKAFFDEVGIAYAKNAGEPKCIELFNENKDSVEPAKLAEFLGE